MNIMPIILTDGYKLNHHKQYPEGTELIYSNFTARSNKHMPNISHVMSFGQQELVTYLHYTFVELFFNSHWYSSSMVNFKENIDKYLNQDYDISHFEKLHALRYLPIEIKALPEGELVPFRVPLLTIKNTHPDFFWLPNFLETLISNFIWKPITSATIAFEYRKVFSKWQLSTDKESCDFVKFQGHDFSMRGLDSIQATIYSGMAHLTSFLGSDSLPALFGVIDSSYYEKGDFICGSVPATEHSVMCAYGQENEFEAIERLIDMYPSGVLSIVCDTWNLWKVVTEYLPRLKDKIMKRDGQIVIRPDSGNPSDIICGLTIDHHVSVNFARRAGCKNIFRTSSDGKYYIINEKTPQQAINVEYHLTHSDKGIIELLWEIFGGNVNAQGYKLLDCHIGCIYGDSITLDVADDICKRLAEKGFTSTNVVFGIGSCSYQFNTRDSLGFAMKSTFAKIKGKDVTLSKDPITDDGVKKSAAGLLRVVKINGEFTLLENQTEEEEKMGYLQTIYKNGNFENKITLKEIREKIDNKIKEFYGS